MFVIFLIAAVFFNGFVPKNLEFKNNFMAAINCVSEMAQTNFIDKYAETVVNVTNGIASNILSALNMSGLTGEKINKQSEDKKRDNKETTPVNTSCDNGIIIKNNTNNSNVLNLLKVKSTGLAYIQNSNEQLKYYNAKITNSGDFASNIGILFFILFSILVVRIKDTIAVLYNNNRIVFINRLG